MTFAFAFALGAAFVAILVMARSRLAGLEYALKRIDDQEFGYCIDCGEEIPLPRLLAMPQATHCVDCAG